MRNLMFITVVDDFFAKNNLAFLTVVINIIAIFAVAKIMVTLAKHISRRLVKKKKETVGDERAKRFETAQAALVILVKCVCYFVAVAVTLGELGLTEAMTSMLAAAGIGGLALSIGAQSFIKDLTAGVFMLFEGNIAVGDMINACGVTGTIETISLRVISVRGLDGELIVIPNGQITTLSNYSTPTHRTYIDVNIAYEADADRALDLMMDEAVKYCAELGSAVNEPPIRVGMNALNASSVQVRVSLAVKPASQFSARRELTRRIKLRFDSEGVEIPYEKVVVLNKKEG